MLFRSAHLVEHLLDRKQPSDERVAPDFDAKVDQVPDLLVDDLVGQAEIGNTVTQDPARLVQGLVDRNRAAGLGQVRRAGHARRAGADDTDAEAIGLYVGSLVPALLDRAIADPALQTTDGDRLKGVADRADAFALVLLRADAAADGRQEVRIDRKSTSELQSH